MTAPNYQNHEVAAKNAVIYLRTSTEEQYPENQLEDCRRFAVSRGYRVEREFVEQLSGWRREVKRPIYEEIRAMAHTGEINAVIVWAIDRWVRQRDTLIEDLTYFPRCGVKFHSVKEEFIEVMNIEGPLGKTIREFMYGLLGSIAEMESQRLSDRTKLGLERARRKGKVLGAPRAKFNKYRAAKLLLEGVPTSQVALEVGVSKATIVRFRKEVVQGNYEYLKEGSESESGVIEPLVDE